ncbi:hypothetical protein [Virgibacillus salinus]|uniref:Uncharacterized protein n=1 Tax=Virgibacillus salinus TaxID=553311 RepID=A0A1H1FK24_9BACI|nr:hypothetical protein [Virgibacillus salinus]SDR01265.1 hypothetical protein SAMN05216231_3258 [Virgibacillus salinus]
MRIRPLVYCCLMVLAVFLLPADTLANNGNSPEKATSQANDKESSNPVAEEVSKKGKQTSQDAKETTNKGQESPEIPEESSNHNKQVSKGTTDKENASNKASEHAESESKDKDSKTLPPQANDQATEQTEKLEQEVAPKKEKVKKQVEDKLHGKKGMSKSTVEKSSNIDEEQTTQAKDNSKNVENPMQSKEMSRISVADSGDKTVQNNNKQSTSENDNILVEQEQRRKSKSIPKPNEDPVSQELMIKPGSLPSPASTSGGDYGGQTSFSSVVKGDLPNSLMFFSKSQVIGKRSEVLRDQWVNAPPAEPPKIAS